MLPPFKSPTLCATMPWNNRVSSGRNVTSLTLRPLQLLTAACTMVLARICRKCYSCSKCYHRSKCYSFSPAHPAHLRLRPYALQKNLAADEGEGNAGVTVCACEVQAVAH